MPNWCTNRLTVRGTPAALDALAEAVRGADTPLSFERILPTPPELSDPDLYLDAAGVPAVIQVPDYDAGREIGALLRAEGFDSGLPEPAGAEPDRQTNIDGAYLSRHAVEVDRAALARILGLVALRRWRVEAFGEVRPAPRREGWYAWRTGHWGTKWDASSPEIEDHPDRLVYRFDTAWAPPEALVAELAARHPDLAFTLDALEEGNRIVCRLVWGASNPDEELVSQDEDDFDEVAQAIWGDPPPGEEAA